MIKAKLDAQTVIRNIDRCLDLTQNFAPLLRVIQGKAEDKKPWTMRGSVARNFVSKSSPDKKPWQSLSEDYAKQKSKKYPGAPMLVASGKLFNSLIRNFEGEDDEGVSIVTAKKLSYGTKIPYAKYHMLGTKKMPARPFIGITDKQEKTWKVLIARYISATINNDQSEMKSILGGGD